MKSKLFIILCALASFQQALCSIPALEFGKFIPNITTLKETGKKELEKAAAAILGTITLEASQSIFSQLTLENYDNYGRCFFEFVSIATTIHSLFESKGDSIKPTISTGANKQWAGRLPGNLNEILELKEHVEILANKGLNSPNGYLFHGVPGTGKTLLARVLAERLQVPLIETNSGQFVTAWRGSGVAKLNAILKAAHSCEAQLPFRCIVFIDEIEIINRGGAGPGSAEDDRLLTALLAAITDPKNIDILWLGATNHIERVDPALQRDGRLSPLELTLPGDSIRRQHIDLFLKNSKEVLDEKTRDFSAAKLNETMKQVLRSHIINRNTSKTSFSKKLKLFLDNEEEEIDLC